MEDEEVRALIRFLRHVMDSEHVSVQGLARRLGFTKSHLSMILSGKRRPGLRFVRATMERYPEAFSRIMSRRGQARQDTKTPPGASPGGE